jgi:polysaccharide pyruvyl transferase WcaK-like protein
VTILADVVLPPRPTLVVGGYGYRNAGDEAILAGLLRLIGRDGVTVMSRSPVETAATHGVRSVSPARVPLELRSHPGIIIGGGGLFGRDMGLLGRFLPVAGLAAAAAGRRVALLGIGVDREMAGPTASVVGALGRRATAVVVRDLESQASLASIGVEALCRPDLSAAVPSAGRAAGLRHLELAGLDPGRRPVVGLSLTAVDDDLGAEVARAIPALVAARPDLDFCLLPMSRHPFVAGHNDEVFARRLMAASPRLKLLVPPDDPAEVLGIFEAFSAAVCMRYHSLLFAERAGIPIIPVAYAEKCRHWLAERSMPSADLRPAALASSVGRAVGLAVERLAV